MKKIFILLVLFFSFNLYAGEGDKYYCQITNGVFITSEEIQKYKEKNTFAFEWTKDKIIFSKEGPFFLKNNESKILYSNSLRDYDIDDFVAVQYTYNVETSENNIPYEIYNFKNGILSINIINQPIEIGTLSFYANCNKF